MREASTTDTTVERASRWVASRLSRRSFLGRAAQLAVVVAGGPALVGLMARQAEARVCGQSGVSAKCPTFDCVGPGRVWGWCWYASPGCCAGPGIKKICDCCTFQYPNVHGYCPSGYNVECIVESCWADPRVMPKPVMRMAEHDGIPLAAAVSRWRYSAGRGGTVVIGDAQNRGNAALAATVAGAVDRPYLLTTRGSLPDSTAAELRRLGATKALLVGPPIGSGVVQALEKRGLTVERVGGGNGLGAYSHSVARWILARRASSRVFALDVGGVSYTVAPLVAAAAAGRSWVVVFGRDAARAVATEFESVDLVYMVGPSMANQAGGVPGANPLRSSTPGTLALELASIMLDTELARNVPLAVCPRFPTLAQGLGGLKGVALYHGAGSLGPLVAGWIRDHQPWLTRGIAAGVGGALDTQGYYDLQSALNHFDTHRLIGVSGQGLPVISQPLAEREIGGARVAGAPPQEENGGYWTSRANR